LAGGEAACRTVGSAVWRVVRRLLRWRQPERAPGPGHSEFGIPRSARQFVRTSARLCPAHISWARGVSAPSGFFVLTGGP